MPAIILTGGKRRRKRLTIPKLPKLRKQAVPIIPVTTAADAERAALQNLAQRLQRGNYNAWRSANYNQAQVANEAAKTAALLGQPTTAVDLVTGASANAVPLTGSGHRSYRVHRRRKSHRNMKGGFLPALIPLIAAAIGAIPGIAGTAVGIANLAEQKRQFNKLYGNAK